MLNFISVAIAKYLIAVSLIIGGIFFLKQNFSTKKHMVIFGIVSMAITYCIAFIASSFYYDPRPFVVNHFVPLIPHIADNGFPSDHTMLTASIAAIVYCFNKKVGIALFTISILIGIARVYIGLHHAIDVIGSIVFAIIGTYVAYRIFKKKYSLDPLC